MTNLITFDGFDNAEIRITDDGRYSVFDVIKFCGKKNPRDAWNVLCEQYPEIVGKTDNTNSPAKDNEKPQLPTAKISYISSGYYPVR